MPHLHVIGPATDRDAPVSPSADPAHVPAVLVPSAPVEAPTDPVEALLTSHGRPVPQLESFDSSTAGDPAPPARSRRRRGRHVDPTTEAT